MSRTRAFTAAGRSDFWKQIEVKGENVGSLRLADNDAAGRDETIQKCLLDVGKQAGIFLGVVSFADYSGDLREQTGAVGKECCPDQVLGRVGVGRKPVTVAGRNLESGWLRIRPMLVSVR